MIVKIVPCGISLCAGMAPWTIGFCPGCASEIHATGARVDREIEERSRRDNRDLEMVLQNATDAQIWQEAEARGIL